MVAIAAQILKGASAHTVSTITYMFDESTSSDERIYSRQIQERYAFPIRELREGDYSLFFHDHDHVRSDVPIAGGGRSAALIACMQAAGVSSLLSGSGGDAVMWNLWTPRMDLADLAIRGCVRPLISRCREYHRREHCSYWDLLWHSVMVPLVRDDRRRVDARERCAWMNWRQVDSLLDGDPPAIDAHRDMCSPSQRHYWRSVAHNIGLVSSGHLGASGCLSVSYPFLDRPLIEFMLSVPPEQRRAPGATRVLHRRALTPLLPPAIVQRRHKGDGAEPLFRAIRREWRRVRAMFASKSQLEQHGLVSSRRLLRVLEDVRNGLYQEPFSLIRVISLEAWLRSLSREGGEDRGL
jgi:asparagine synthase (glutamine-hydrolysing)